MYKETNAHVYHSTNQESTNQHNTKYWLGRGFGLFKICSRSNGVILWLSQVVTIDAELMERKQASQI